MRKSQELFSVKCLFLSKNSKLIFRRYGQRSKTVRFGHRPQRAAGIPHGHHTSGNAACHHAPGPDHTSGTNGHSTAENRTGSDPDIVLQRYRRGSADSGGALRGIQRMARTGDDHARARKALAPMWTGDVSRITQL